MFFRRLLVAAALFLAAPIPAAPLAHECAALIVATGFAADDPSTGIRRLTSLRELERDLVRDQFDRSEWQQFLMLLSEPGRGFTRSRTFFVVEGPEVLALIQDAKAAAPVLWATHERAQRLQTAQEARRLDARYRKLRSALRWGSGMAAILGVALLLDVRAAGALALIGILPGTFRSARMPRTLPPPRDVSAARCTEIECLQRIYQLRPFLDEELIDPNETLMGHQEWTNADGTTDHVEFLRAPGRGSALIVSVWRQ